MTGHERLEAALSPAGTRSTPAVVCYEGILVRDHWEQLTRLPWWYRDSPDLSEQLQWRREAIAQLDLDWFTTGRWYSREWRQRHFLKATDGQVYRIDRQTGEQVPLEAPRVGGWVGAALHSVRPARPPATEAEVDARLPLPAPDAVPEADGSGELAAALLREYGGRLYPLAHVPAPLWHCYPLWGFEQLMELVATRPELVEHACRRALAQAKAAVRDAAALGVRGIWIEECMTDMIGPEAFARLNLPCVRELADTVQAAGMHSIYYFCGNPAGKWDLLLAAGADALSLEESKKGFTIDILQAARRVGGRCALLGNLDAIGVLQDGTDADVQAEIGRQLEAAALNNGRFVMCTGSPVTPSTPVARVRDYVRWVRRACGQ